VNLGSWVDTHVSMGHQGPRIRCWRRCVREYFSKFH
jgi:hypothetical protein